MLSRAPNDSQLTRVVLALISFHFCQNNGHGLTVRPWKNISWFATLFLKIKVKQTNSCFGSFVIQTDI